MQKNIFIFIVLIIVLSFVRNAVDDNGEYGDLSNAELNENMDIITVHDHDMLEMQSILNDETEIINEIFDEDQFDNNLSLSDDISLLMSNPSFTNHGLILNDIDSPVNLDRESALALARKYKGEEIASNAKSITAILASLTDNEIPTPSGTDIELVNYPVWIVTYYGVSVKPRFTDPIIVDTNVIIDAKSGELLEVITYNAE